MTNVEKARKELQRGGALHRFVSNPQRLILQTMLHGEEKYHFADVVLEAAGRVEKMPKPYETEGLGQQATVWLHYFKGSTDAWITEKDAGDLMDDRQHQAFGKITNNGIKADAEFVYISIEELTSCGCELDLYWTPVTLATLFGKESE